MDPPDPAFHSGRTWLIQLFGGLRAAGPHRVIDRFRTQKTAGLLAYLAYYPQRPHLREELIELLWGEDELPAGRHKLRLALASLRAQFEGPEVPQGTVLIADRTRLSLNLAAFQTDVCRFEGHVQAAEAAGDPSVRIGHLQSAAALYKGDLLPGHYEEWVLGERTRLERDFLRSARTLGRLLYQRGDSPGAVSQLSRVTRIDPLDEASHRELIQILARTDGPSSALRVYREYEERLADELGTAPSEYLRRLARELLQAPAPVSPAGGEAPKSEPPVRGAGGTRTLLLAELTAWPAAASDEPDAACPMSRLETLTVEHGGTEMSSAGGVLLALFDRARDAGGCALALQQAGQGRTVRCALHTWDDTPEEAGERLSAERFGRRILAAAHPGQVLCSAATGSLLAGGPAPSCRVRDLGEYLLSDHGGRLLQLELPGHPPVEFPPPRAEPAVRSTLPHPLTRFFGRERALVELERLLSPAGDGSRSSRLITLTGPGGTGKTRLAIELGSRLSRRYGSPVWYVPLTEVSAPAGIPATLLEAQRQTTAPGIDRFAYLVDLLRQRPLLLILDNFDHLVEEGSAWVRRLLEAVPDLVCVVTSRRALELESEQEYPVRPLDVPGAAGSIREIAGSASVRLFLDRAQQVRPDFQVTPANAATVGQLCRRLEGIPLALELAAARVRLLNLDQMLGQLGQRLDFLATRRRDVPVRHRSLRSALDWSYQTLQPELQRAFAELSVFRGGGSLAAAEAVLSGDLSALEVLDELRACSLVNTGESDGSVRFAMLETVREYAAEQLVVAGDLSVHDRHARFFRAATETQRTRFRTPGEREALLALAVDWENLLAALHWTRERTPSSADNRSCFVDLCLSVGQFLQHRGELGESLSWIQAGMAAARGGSPPLDRSLAALLREECGLYIDRGDYAAARIAAAQSLSLAVLASAPEIAAGAKNLLGLAEHGLGRHAAARPHFAAAISQFLELRNTIGAGMASNNLGALEQDDPDGSKDRALQYLRRALELFQGAGYTRGVADALANLGILCQLQNDLPHALEYYTAALELEITLGQKLPLARALTNQGEVLQLLGEEAVARRRLVAAEVLFRQVGSPHQSYTATLLEQFTNPESRQAIARDRAALHDQSVEALLRFAMNDPA